jgi:recombining binding protein (suppressor of hairless)
VTYGSEIQLVDSLTGITTNPLIIRKVDKGKVSAEDGGPVSQMQKIALQRINADGSRSYLSAAGPVPGAPVPGAPTPGSAGQPASHPLLFQAPRVRDEVRDGVRIVTDEVDDYLCWTIVGICEPFI